MHLIRYGTESIDFAANYWPLRRMVQFSQAFCVGFLPVNDAACIPSAVDHGDPVST